MYKSDPNAAGDVSNVSSLLRSLSASKSLPFRSAENQVHSLLRSLSASEFIIHRTTTGEFSHEPAANYCTSGIDTA